MTEEGCAFTGDCAYRGKCACGGLDNHFCKITDRVGGLVFVEKSLHPNCSVKTYFGGAHICLCPAMLEIS
jgi:hypothetical protein